MQPLTKPDPTKPAEAASHGKTAPAMATRAPSPRVFAVVATVVALLLIAVLPPLFLPGYSRVELTAAPPSEGAELRRAAVLERQMQRLAPRGLYVTVDTYGNRVRVHRDGEMLREAICSTGSGVVLKDPRGSKQWTFETPLGVRRVISKTKDPVWTKPDWAFIEEGFEPPASWSERRDHLSLGDYSLNLGDGYLIHGTLFQTLLGRAITHGCIRLGDEDLEYLYRNVPTGAQVLLY
jgi:L,D-transpeptidase YbiS